MTAARGVKAADSMECLKRLRTALTDDSVRNACLEAGLLTEVALKRLSGSHETVIGLGSEGGLLSQILRTAAAPEDAVMDSVAAAAGLPRLTRHQLQDLHAARLQHGQQLSSWPNPKWCQEQRMAIGCSPSHVSGSAPVICIASAQALSAHAYEVLRRATQLSDASLAVALALPSDLIALGGMHTDSGTRVAAKSDLAHLRELAEEGPIIELVNQVLSRAVTQRASDIHSEPKDLGFVVRIRVDGQMLMLDQYTQQSYDAFVCRIKILAGLDIAERRLPQDGRIDARINGEHFDVRVSIIPAVSGESIVLRLLRQERSIRTLADLGFTPDDATRFESWARLPNGIVLVTGPTGSGKSTTLYTALELSKRNAEKIITVEDPVEYRIEDITQIQVHEEIGLTFAAALRSVLRHDPDVVLLGEIRDVETAKIAVQAALTGHLVLSTLHTNSAEGAVTRLTDMGVDAYLLADSLRAVLAQRLVRKLCIQCSVPDTLRQADIQAAPPPDLLPILAGFHERSEQIRLMRPVGCSACNLTGYRGRTAVFDLLEISAQARAKIKPGISATELVQLRTTAAGVTTSEIPWGHAWLQALRGVTTLDEVLLIVQLAN
jgi:general secretion pathway protein E